MSTVAVDIGRFEQLTLQDPEADADTFYHVPGLVAGGTPTDVKTLRGFVEELDAEAAVRAGLDSARGAYRVTLYDEAEVMVGRLLKRDLIGETLEITSIRRAPVGEWFMRALCRRSR